MGCATRLAAMFASGPCLFWGMGRRRKEDGRVGMGNQSRKIVSVVE